MVRKLTSKRCQVCRHDERWRIELLRAGGASLEALATKFGLHKDAIHRHWRDHVTDQATAAARLMLPGNLRGHWKRLRASPAKSASWRAARSTSMATSRS